MIGIDDPEYAGATDGAHGVGRALHVRQRARQAARADPRDDIVTKLINAEIDGDQLTELEFDMFMLLLTVAGNETTRNTTAWGMWALMENPEQYKRTCATISTPRSTAAIEEILRWATPVYHFRRTATADTELHGPRDRRGRQGRHVAHLGQPRREPCSTIRSASTSRAGRTSTSRSAAVAPTSAWAPTSPAWSCTSSSDEILERIPDMHLAGEPRLLRSNFIGGVKHMPVKYTAGARVDS